jgi:hypothetical protein
MHAVLILGSAGARMLMLAASMLRGFGWSHPSKVIFTSWKINVYRSQLCAAIN